MKSAIITFDYEPFLGKKIGSIQNCVIHPTELILKALKKNQAKSIFFVDVTWLLFIKNYFLSDYKIVADQIKKIIDTGSSVELHLHPHWRDAYVKEGDLYFKSFDHYTLNSLHNSEIIELFESGIDLLEKITSKKIKCFRAGGFCIEPFSNIKPAFDKFGIKYDFSVVPGINLRTGNTYDFDFSNVYNRSFYTFNDEAIREDINGHFIEFPLSIYRNNPIYRLVNKTLLILSSDKIKGDGEGIQANLSISSRIKSKKMGFAKSMLTLDETHTILFKYLLKSHFNNTEIVTILSHSKTFSDQALKNLEFVIKSYNTMNSEDLDQLK